jgi:hypothetical protein
MAGQQSRDILISCLDYIYSLQTDACRIDVKPEPAVNYIICSDIYVPEIFYLRV